MGHEQGTDSSTQAPEIVEKLARHGVPEEVLKEVQSGYLRQQDYTKKRQEESEQVRQMQAQIAFLLGRQQASDGKGTGNDDPVEAFLEERDDGSEVSANVKDLLRGFADRLVQKFEGQMQQRLAPIEQDAIVSRTDSVLRDYVEQNLVPEFGEGVRDLVKDLLPEMKKELLAGRKVIPEVVLFSKKREHMLKLLERKAKGIDSDSSRHLEGLTTAKHSRAPFSSSGFETEEKTQKRPYSGIDARKIADEVLRELDLT
jgi:hypothetical protein